MADDPFKVKESGVVISLKAGPYEAPWITIHEGNIADALERFGPDLAKLMQQTAEAQASFTRMYDKAKNAKIPEPGSYGKPDGADQVNTETELPFANSKAPEKETTCAHGARTRVEAGGKVGWICSVPKGQPGRCETIFE
jgi:hypothetical protein